MVLDNLTFRNTYNFSFLAQLINNCSSSAILFPNIQPTNDEYRRRNVSFYQKYRIFMLNK